MNARDAAAGKKTPWKERVRVIRDEFPSVETLDWNRAMQADPMIMQRIIDDIVKVDVAEPGRSGPRPSLTAESNARRRQLLGEDYSYESFTVALRALVGTRSLQHAARKCGIAKTFLWSLLRGEKEPSVEMMERIAAGFGKEPSYFVEYRSAYVAAALAARLEGSPEQSVVVFNRVRQFERRAV